MHFILFIIFYLCYYIHLFHCISLLFHFIPCYSILNSSDFILWYLMLFHVYFISSEFPYSLHSFYPIPFDRHFIIINLLLFMYSLYFIIFIVFYPIFDIFYVIILSHAIHLILLYLILHLFILSCILFYAIHFCLVCYSFYFIYIIIFHLM